jgi:hypothetical protein
MKRLFCTGALGLVLGSAAPAALAVYLNPNGLGQVLEYPYYTVNAGYATYFTIVNTTDVGKAVKVRLLEGYDGRDTLDFNLYLSPLDVWVGGIVAGSDGGAALFTNDNSCTVPALPSTAATALAFSIAAFDGGGAFDGGPIDSSRTREGHIEIVEMGTVVYPSATLDAISQVGGVPENCPSIVKAWASAGYWSVNPSVDLGPPSGGIFGSGVLVNVPQGTVFSYAAEAVAQFYNKDGMGEHSAPGALTPNIASGTSVTALVYANDAPLSLTYARPIDAVSALFMADNIQNEFWTSASVAAASEWVVTYPTKRFYVDPLYAAQNSSIHPFDAVFSGVLGGSSISLVNMKFVNREGAFASTNDECGYICPGRSVEPNLPYEVQVVTFNQNAATLQNGPRDVTPSPPSWVLGSKLVPMNVETASYGDLGGGQVVRATDGWASLQLTTNASAQLTAAANGDILFGQPVSGFWINQLVNGNVAGTLANYTAAYRHKLHASCLRADSTPCS